MAGVTTTTNRRAPISTRFRRAAAGVVEDASYHVADARWVVARREGDDLVALSTPDDDQRPRPGDRVHLVGDADVEMALELPDGSNFGALCGLGAKQVEIEQSALAAVLRLAELLGSLACAEWEADEQASRAQAEAERARQVEQEAYTDALTGLANRRAWDRAIEAEERRHRRYGGAASVLVVDLDDLKRVNDSQGHLHGDLLLRLVSKVITSTSRDSDVIARTGGDEFAVLALNCDEPQLRVLVSRMRRALEEEGVNASVGGVCRSPSSGMAEAWAEADVVMLAEKTKRKSTS